MQARRWQTVFGPWKVSTRWKMADYFETAVFLVDDNGGHILERTFPRRCTLTEQQARITHKEVCARLAKILMHAERKLRKEKRK